MMTPEQVIAQALSFEQRPTTEAQRVMAALTKHGYRIVSADLPETTRTYAAWSAQHCPFAD